jgi:2-polyprenyl-3-methyl-5-hydroxy-6-metoxy-1,4-benzoquinol methylase
LLDVGTGKGALLEQAQALGYDAEGIDVCDPLVQEARARGLRVARSQVEDLSGRDRFDVVTMMDVIEHVPEPRRVLAAAHRLLASGGQLVVYTPNHRGAVVLLARFLHCIGIDFAMREIFGGNHVSFFDDRSLPRALNSEGFAVRALRLFPYDPSRPGGPISRVSLSAVAAVERFGALFQRTFRMLAVATK